MAARPETPEALTPDGFKKDGYNADIDIPVAVEPTVSSGKGQAHDVRKMNPDGVVVIHDDDDDILDEDRKADADKPSR